MATNPPPSFVPGVSHEKTDADVGKLALFGGSLFVVLVVAIIGMRLLFVHYEGVQERSAAPVAFATPRPLPPEPRLQPDARNDLQQYRSDQMQELSSYGWVDRQKGIVHIPIDRAMQMIVAQGLPVRSATQQAARTAHPDTETAEAAGSGPSQVPATDPAKGSTGNATR